MVYSYINSKKAVKDNIRALNDKNGIRVEDPAQTVRILNEQFKSVFEKDNGEIPDINSVRERVKEISSESYEYDWGDLTDIREEEIFKKN